MAQLGNYGASNNMLLRWTQSILVTRDFTMIENHPTVPIDYIADADALQRSHKLYALLASLVKGRGVQVIQRTPSSNGYEAMKQLIQLSSDQQN